MEVSSASAIGIPALTNSENTSVNLFKVENFIIFFMRYVFSKNVCHEYSTFLLFSIEYLRKKKSIAPPNKTNKP